MAELARKHRLRRRAWDRALAVCVAIWMLVSPLLLLRGAFGPALAHAAVGALVLTAAMVAMRRKSLRPLRVLAVASVVELALPLLVRHSDAVFLNDVFVAFLLAGLGAGDGERRTRSDPQHA